MQAFSTGHSVTTQVSNTFISLDNKPCGDFSILLQGDFACFTRPEFKIERVSYDIMTPSAARGALESIFWRPGMTWVIHRISVLRPIRFIRVNRYELAIKGSVPTLNEVGDHTPGRVINAAEHRQSRSALILRDVAYVVDASIEMDLKLDLNRLKKFKAVFHHRIKKGQCYRQPYLGCREFSAEFRLLQTADKAPIAESRRLGWMLRHIKWTGSRAIADFFDAELINGTVAVPTSGCLASLP